MKFSDDDLSFYLTDDGLECFLGKNPVGYIRVDSRSRVKFVFVGHDFRRRRVGIVLYQRMAKQLATVGKKLYASDYQHENAIALWNWLKENDKHFGVDQDGRWFLSYC